MAPLDGYLKDPKNSNWVKCGLALNITNEVLGPFVVKEITKLHQSIVTKLPPGVLCGGCRVNNRCPNYICNKIQCEIEINHWYHTPSFTNTCTGRWCTEPWEIAKCYMPPSMGCKSSSAADADFSACINVIINCKQFQAFGTNDPRATPETNLSKSRDFRNLVMHARSRRVSDNYMKEHLDVLINVLNMVKTPESEADTEEAIHKIEQIKTNQLVLNLEDVIEVRKNATEAIADKTEKDSEQVQRERLLVNFETGCRKALCRLTEERISKQEENLTVADFLSSIRFLAVVKNLCQRHQDMLFPKYGSHADIREWDLFVYCFILEELDLHEAIGNAVFLFVQEVKKIRDKLLLDATGVTQNDLSEVCEYLIDTDLNTEITEIFNKASPDVDVIRSNNILVSWWREEEDYGNKQVSKKQLNKTKQTLKKLDERIQKNEKRLAEVEDKVQILLEKSEHKEEKNMTLQGAYGSEIGTECNLEVHGCDRVTKEALQEDITSPNNNDIKEPLNHVCRELNLREVKPVKGSIILNVTCSSITNLIDFWDSIIDGRAVEALSGLRDYYRQYFKCDTLIFDVVLSKKGVSRCVNEIGEGLSSHFEGLVDKVTQKVNKILKAKDEELITGSVEHLKFGDEGWDNQASLAGYSYLGQTMVMEEPHPPSEDPINNPNALTDDEILEYSKRLGGCRWETFAIDLGYKRNQIDKLKDTYQFQIDDEIRLYTMLEKWQDVVVGCGENPKHLLAAVFFRNYDYRLAKNILRTIEHLKELEELRPKRETAEKIQMITFEDDLIPYHMRQRRCHQLAQRYTSSGAGYIDYSITSEIPAKSGNRRFQTKRKEEGINQKKQSKDDPVRYLVPQRRRYQLASRYTSSGAGYFSELYGVGGLLHIEQDVIDKFQEELAMYDNWRLQTKRKEEGINQKKQSKAMPSLGRFRRFFSRRGKTTKEKKMRDKQLIPGSDTDSTGDENDSGFMSSRSYGSRLKRISTRGDAWIHQEKQIKGYSYLGPTMVMEEPHPSSKDPINNPNALTADEILEYSNRLDDCRWETIAIDLGYTRNQIDELKDTYDEYEIEKIQHKMLQKWHDVVVGCGEKPKRLLHAAFIENHVYSPDITLLEKWIHRIAMRKRRPKRETAERIQMITFEERIPGTDKDPTSVDEGSEVGPNSCGRDIDKNPSEKDLISKSQQRVRTTSKTEFDKKPKLHQTSHGFENVEGEPVSLSKMYTQPAKKPVD